jgi:hypothetical protein
MKTKLLLATLVCFGTVPVAHAQEITGLLVQDENQQLPPQDDARIA